MRRAHGLMIIIIIIIASDLIGHDRSVATCIQWQMGSSGNFAFLAMKTFVWTVISCADRVRKSIGNATSVESERGTIPSSCVRSATNNFATELEIVVPSFQQSLPL